LESPTESHCQGDRPPAQPAGRSAGGTALPVVGRPASPPGDSELAGRAVVTPVTKFKHVRAAHRIGNASRRKLSTHTHLLASTAYSFNFKNHIFMTVYHQQKAAAL
jgi:hypothetical protein